MSPRAQNVNIATATLCRLAQIENIVGVKEASGNISQITQVIQQVPRDFLVLSGDDAITLPLIAMGGHGIISVVSNEVPSLFSSMVRLGLKGRFPEALRLQYRLLDLMNVNFVESSPIPVKAALAMMGRIGEYYRLPLVPIGDANRQKLRKILKTLDLL